MVLDPGKMNASLMTVVLWRDTDDTDSFCVLSSSGMEACQSSIIIKCSSKGPIIRGKKKQEGDNKEDLRWTTKITIMKTTMRTKWTMKNNNNDEENKQKCQRNPGWYIEGRKSRDTVPLRRKSAGSYIYKNVISRIGSVHFTCLYNLFV